MNQFSGALIVALLLVSAIGCDPSSRMSYAERASMNSWAMATYSDPAMDNAVIAQHTLFPYHFVPDSDALNDLGQRDLAVLAANFRRSSGELGVRRGDAPDALYLARMAKVSGQLVATGVDVKRVHMSDALAGGPGLYSERCLVILGAETLKLGGAETLKPVYPVYPATVKGPLAPSTIEGTSYGPTGATGGRGPGPTGAASPGTTGAATGQTSSGRTIP